MNTDINKQPKDATYAETLREFAFKQVIDKGLSDSKNSRVIGNQEMKQKINSWGFKQ